MRYKLTFFLILANAIVFYMIYLLANRPVDQSGINEALLPPIFMTQITSIGMSGSAVRQTELVKRENDWKIVKPYAWQANTFAVQEIISQLEQIKQTASFPRSEVENLQDYGLENPLLEITLKTEKEQRVLRFGQPSDGGIRFYMLSPDEKTIHVIGENLTQAFNNAYVNLYDGRVLPVPMPEINSITTQQGLLRVRLNKADSGWKFETPIQTDANNNAVERELSFLTKLSVISFVPPERAASINKETPSLRLTIGSNNREYNKTLLILEKAPPEETDQDLVFAIREGEDVVFTLDAQKLEHLKKIQTILREKRLLKIDPTKISSILISQDTQTVVLEKLENDSWQVYERVPNAPSLSKYSAEPSIISSILQKLSTLQADEFVSDAPTEEQLVQYGFSHPFMTISIEAGTSKENIVIGNIDELGDAYIKLGDPKRISSIYKINITEDFDKAFPIPPIAFNYRNKTIKAFPENSSVEKFSITLVSDSNNIFNYDKTTFDSAKVSPETANAVNSILASALNFKVENYIVQDFDANDFHFGDELIPWSYKLIADIKLPDGSIKKVELLFTKRMQSFFQTVGSDPEQKLVFFPQQNVIDALFQLTEKIPESNPEMPNPESDLTPQGTKSES